MKSINNYNGNTEKKVINRLKQYFIEVTSSCIDYSDEWEYRRLVELVFFAVPELKQKILEYGEKSENYCKTHLNTSNGDIPENIVLEYLR